MLKIEPTFWYRGGIAALAAPGARIGRAWCCRSFLFRSQRIQRFGFQVCPRTCRRQSRDWINRLGMGPLVNQLCS
jgi:hypothetical protein